MDENTYQLSLIHLRKIAISDSCIEQNLQKILPIIKTMIINDKLSNLIEDFNFNFYNIFNLLIRYLTEYFATKNHFTKAENNIDTHLMTEILRTLDVLLQKTNLNNPRYSKISTLLCENLPILFVTNIEYFMKEFGHSCIENFNFTDNNGNQDETFLMELTVNFFEQELAVYNLFNGNYIMELYLLISKYDTLIKEKMNTKYIISLVLQTCLNTIFNKNAMPYLSHRFIEIFFTSDNFAQSITNLNQFLASNPKFLYQDINCLILAHIKILYLTCKYLASSCEELLPLFKISNGYNIFAQYLKCLESNYTDTLMCDNFKTYDFNDILNAKNLPLPIICLANVLDYIKKFCYISTFDTEKYLMTVLIKAKMIWSQQIFIVNECTVKSENLPSYLTEDVHNMELDKNLICNLDAFDVFANVISQTDNTLIAILTMIQMKTVYNANKLNYYALESLNSLSKISESLLRFCQNGSQILDIFYETLRYILIDLYYVPFKEFISISITFSSVKETIYEFCAQTTSLPDDKLLKLVSTSLNYLIFSLNHLMDMVQTPLCLDIYRECGLYESLIYFLLCVPLNDKPFYQNLPNDSELYHKYETFSNVILDFFLQITIGNEANSKILTKNPEYSQCVKYILNFKNIFNARSEVTSFFSNRGEKFCLLFEHMSIYSEGDVYIRTLVRLLGEEINISNKLKIIEKLKSAALQGPIISKTFRNLGGFNAFLSALSLLKDDLQTANNQGDGHTLKFENRLLQNLFELLHLLLEKDLANEAYFLNEIGWQNFGNSIISIGPFSLAKNCLVKSRDSFNLDTYKEICCIINAQNSHNPSRLNGFMFIPNIIKYLISLCFDKSQRFAIKPNTYPLEVENNITLKRTFPLLIMCNFVSHVPLNNESVSQQTIAYFIFDLFLAVSKLNDQNSYKLADDHGNFLMESLLKDYCDALIDSNNVFHERATQLFKMLAHQCLLPSHFKTYIGLALKHNSPINISDEVFQNRLYTLYNTLCDLCSYSKSNVPSLSNIPYIRIPQFENGYEEKTGLFFPNIFSHTVGLKNISTDDITKTIKPEKGFSILTWFNPPTTEELSPESPIIIPLFSIHHTLNNDDTTNARIWLQINLVIHYDETCMKYKVILKLKSFHKLYQTGDNYITECDFSINDTSNGNIKNDILKFDEWNCLICTFRRNPLNYFTIIPYVNSYFLGSKKLTLDALADDKYGSANFYGCIGEQPYGTEPQIKYTWKQGLFYLFDKCMGVKECEALTRHGPRYLGCFPFDCIKYLTDNPNDVTEFAISPSKIILGIHPLVKASMTFAKLKKIYDIPEPYALHKHLMLANDQDNETPLNLFCNVSSHLNSIEDTIIRPIGAISLNYFDVKDVINITLPISIYNTGGAKILLGMLSMANTDKVFYAALKTLYEICKSNHAILMDFNKINGFTIMGYIATDKSSILNTQSLSLLFAIIDYGIDNNNIPSTENSEFYHNPYINYNFWFVLSDEKFILLLSHIKEHVNNHSSSTNGKKYLQDLIRDGIIENIIYIMRNILQKDETTLASNIKICAKNVSLMLDILDSLLLYCSLKHLELIGLFLLSLIVDQKEAPNFPFDLEKIEIQNLSHSEQIRYLKITIMNCVLASFYNICSNEKPSYLTKVIYPILGLEWFFYFLHPSMHLSTVVIALRFIIQIMRHEKVSDFVNHTIFFKTFLGQILKRYNILGYTLLNVSKKIMEVHDTHVGDSKGLHTMDSLFHILLTHLNFDGDTVIYPILLAWVFNQPVRLESYVTYQQINLDSLFRFVFGVSPNYANDIFKTEIKTIHKPAYKLVVKFLSYVESKIPEDTKSLNNAYQIIQFLIFIYHNSTVFQRISMNSDIIQIYGMFLIDGFGFKSNILDNANNNVDDDMVIIESTKYFYNLDFATKLKRQILDFLKTVIIDSFEFNYFTTESPLNVILEPCSGIDRNTLSIYQTTLLTLLMQNLIAYDPFTTNNCDDKNKAKRSSIFSSTNLTTFNKVINVVYFALVLVDKVWQGMFNGPIDPIFDFMMQLLHELMRNQYKNINKVGFYNAFNRLILFQMSQDVLENQASILNCLRKLLNFKQYLLIKNRSANFHNFIGCLCYCLFHINDSIDYLENKKFVIPVEKDEIKTDADASPNKPDSTFRGDLFEIKEFCRNIWEELYLHHRAILEEFKLAPNPTWYNNLNNYQPPFYEACKKVWTGYIESEQKFTQLKSEIHFGGFAIINNEYPSIASYESILPTNFSNKPEIMEQIDLYPLATSSVTRDYKHVVFIDNNYLKCISNILKQFNTQLESFDLLLTVLQDIFSKVNTLNMKYISQQWHKQEELLIGERCIWGYMQSNFLTRYKLDYIEGPYRMRKRFIKNSEFFTNYVESSSAKPLLKDCNDQNIFENLRLKNLSHNKKKHIKVSENEHTNPNNDALNTSIFDTSIEKLEHELSKLQTKQKNKTIPTPNKKLHLLTHKSITQDTDTDETAIDDETNKDTSEDETLPAEMENKLEFEPDIHDQPIDPDNELLLKLLEENATIRAMFRCSRIDGLDSHEGLFLFGITHAYLIDGFTLLKSKQICDIKTLASTHHDPIIPFSPVLANHEKECHKLAYADVSEVCKRRYLLQPIGLELFLLDGRTFFIVFPKATRDKVYQKFKHFLTCTDTKSSLINNQISQNTLQNKPLLKLFEKNQTERSPTDLWTNGEIDNFTYLMCLNTLSGRSYNDLMQYPIFPWIIADYDSHCLDLNCMNTYRDLSKPMGAQTPKRLEQYIKRYNDWEKDVDMFMANTTPPYHYGTCYSSAMIVASYLVRMEPFTQYFFKLQGGHFDLPDRMFHNIKDSWLSASLHNMADVKELIPEFFYGTGAFLCNRNQYNFGIKQNGVELNHVELPLWAKGSPENFIRINRAALESDYVSYKLNEWIDLIFGCKQRGQSAIDSINVFHYLFYEGSSDVYMIEDPMEKNAIVGFINNFGQIPLQLFKKPHPCKKINLLSFHLAMLPLDNENKNINNSNSDKDTNNIMIKGNMPKLKMLKKIVNKNIIRDVSAMATSQIYAKFTDNNRCSDNEEQMAESVNNVNLHYYNILYCLEMLTLHLHYLKAYNSAIGQIIQLNYSSSPIVMESTVKYMVVEQNKFILSHAKQTVEITWGLPDKSITVKCNNPPEYFIGNQEIKRFIPIIAYNLNDHTNYVTSPNSSNFNAFSPSTLNLHFYPSFDYINTGNNRAVTNFTTSLLPLNTNLLNKISTVTIPYQTYMVGNGFGADILCITAFYLTHYHNMITVKENDVHKNQRSNFVSTKTNDLKMFAQQQQHIKSNAQNPSSLTQNKDDVYFMQPLILFAGGSDGVIRVIRLYQPTDNNFASMPPTLYMHHPYDVEHLYGHDGPITCLASCSTNEYVVSGSRDCTTILWDAVRLQFLRQLVPNPKISIESIWTDEKPFRYKLPISCIHINPLTGHVISCSGSHVYLWDINGEYICHADIHSYFKHSQQQSQFKVFEQNVPKEKLNKYKFYDNTSHLSSKILSCDMTHLTEWDPAQLIILGATDGLIRILALEYCDIPTPLYTKEKEKNPVLDLTNSDVCQFENGFESFSPEDIIKANEEIEHKTQILGKIPFAYYYNDQQAAAPIINKCGLTSDKPRLVLKAVLITPCQDISAITSVSASRDHRQIVCGDAKGRVFIWTLPYNASEIAHIKWLQNFTKKYLK